MMSKRGVDICLEIPKKFRSLASQAHQVADNYFRPISRKYDKTEHTYPKELDLLVTLLGDMNNGSSEAVGATSTNKRAGKQVEEGIKNGGNLSALLGVMELCWNGVGLLLAILRQGLDNATVTTVASEEQLQCFGGTQAAMVATELGYGSGSTTTRIIATQDGDHYILNGEKISVASGGWADAAVVQATLNRNLGRMAIKSFVAEKGTPRMTVIRLGRKLGVKTSDTAPISLNDCWVPAVNLLDNAEVGVQRGFAGTMETFDSTRPLVAGMVVGVAKAALNQTRELLKEAGYRFDYKKPLLTVSYAEVTLYRLEAGWEATRLLTLKAAWMADNKLPSSKEASVAKARAGRVVNEITLKCVELAGALGYAEGELLEKWTWDSKILDIFEGTQQIQLLIVARHSFGKSSSQLKQKGRQSPPDSGADAVAPTADLVAVIGWPQYQPITETDAFLMHQPAVLYGKASGQSRAAGGRRAQSAPVRGERVTGGAPLVQRQRAETGTPTIQARHQRATFEPLVDMVEVRFARIVQQLQTRVVDQLQRDRGQTHVGVWTP